MDARPIYCISGLGVDGRVFVRLRLEGRPLRFIHWLEPLRGESFRSYCGRMADQIPESGPVEIIAQSFGGLIAIEIAKFRPVTKIFLISSIKSHREKPWFFRLMRYLPMYFSNQKWIRDRTTWLWGPFFGLNSKADVKLFYRMMPGLSDYYMRWSVKNIVRWKNDKPTVPLVHIHGGLDRIFPIKNIPGHDHLVSGATHSMVFTHGKEVSDIINEHLRIDNRHAVAKDAAAIS